MTEETTATTANSKVGEIIETIGGLTVLELAELVKALEDKFGVSAAAPVMMAGAMPSDGGGEEAAEEKDSFDVVLTSVGEKKIQVIKIVREITSLGLKEAKASLTRHPSPSRKGRLRKKPKKFRAGCRTPEPR